MEVDVHVMTIVCPTTRLINLQVVESKKADGIICGFTRLSFEVGLPKYVFTDQDSGIIAAMEDAELEIRDTQYRLHKEQGIVFTVCPVGGHNQHGQVERVIRSVQQSLEECNIKQQKLHATVYKPV